MVGLGDSGNQGVRLYGTTNVCVAVRCAGAEVDPAWQKRTVVRRTEARDAGAEQAGRERTARPGDGLERPEGRTEKRRRAESRERVERVQRE